MIDYSKSPFGLNLILRISGSAVYRATIPGAFSVAFLVIMRQFWENPEGGRAAPVGDELMHPYTITVLITGTIFLLVFRLQSAYQRYWEAAGAINQMMSKWMDAVTHTAAYHMQCHHYDMIKPPSFFDYHELNAFFLSRTREELLPEEDATGEANTERVYDRATKKSIEKVGSSEFRSGGGGGGGDSSSAMMRISRTTVTERGSVIDSSEKPAFDREGNPLPTRLEGPAQLDGNWGAQFGCGKATYYDRKHPYDLDPKGFVSIKGGLTPSLFLQELSHLASLMNAIALSTLRNDVEGAESPLDIYRAGAPWPDVDPHSKVTFESVRMSIRNFIGWGRTPEERTKYNASRPLPVIGGVSGAEIKFLQMARGPYAKTQLSWYWLSEFITREHLAGSTGDVGPPIISRIIQFLSDGMTGYNQARKIMFIPFPFPHAQIAAIFALVAVPVVAFLMDQFVIELWVGCCLTFMAVTVISGIHEVARELENPFRNVPNELPLVTIQAQFNEALIVMFSGYHPDHFWQHQADKYKRYGPPTKGVLHPSLSQISSASSEPSTSKEKRNSPNDENTETTAKEEHHKDSTDDKIQMLMAKIEQQSQELERLRVLVTPAQTGTYED